MADRRSGSGQRVVVVGAGLLGSALAVALRDRNCEVVLLERAIAGAEASTAAAGILGPHIEAHDDGPFVDLGLYGLKANRAWSVRLREEGRVDVQLREDGAWALAFSDEEAAALQVRAAWQKARGMRVIEHDAAAVRAALPAFSPDVRAGLFFPDDASLDPRALHLGLQALVQKAGVQVRQNAFVHRFLLTADRCTGVSLRSGDIVRGDVVVVCAGAWSGVALAEGLADGGGKSAGVGPDHVFPVRGQMVQLQVDPALVPTVVFGRGGYLVPRRDGRLLVGSTTEKRGFDKRVTPAGIHALLERAMALVPTVAEAPLTSTWCGLRPGSRDGLPYLGETAVPGLWVSSGHYRNGVLLGCGTADLLAAAIVGQTPALSLAPFSPRR